MTSRAVRTLVSLVLLLVGGSVSALSVSPGDSMAATTDTATTPAATSGSTAKLPVELGIRTLTPTIPDGTSSQTFSVSGVAVNKGTASLKNLITRLRVERIDYRSDMQVAPKSDDGRQVPISDEDKHKIASLAVGGQSAWSFTDIPMSTLLGSYYSSQPGVYAVDVQVEDENGIAIGISRTYLPWKPVSDDKGAAIGVALLWPLVGPPALDGIRDASSGSLPEVANTDLLTQISPTGRLTDVLTKANHLVVNWVVDPDLLTGVGEIAAAGDYQVRTTGPKPTIGQQTSDPQTFLSKLQGAFAGGSCWSLPFADPDLSSLAHGAGSDGAAVLGQSAIMQPPVTAVSCQGSNRVLAWPADGQADKATVDLIRSSLQTSATVVSGSFDKLPTNGSFDLDGKAVLQGSSADSTVNAVVSDPDLDATFTPGDDGISDPGLMAGQRWLAQTALIAREGTHTGRTLMAAPPRDFDPPQELVDAIRAETQLPADQQWFQLSDLENLVKPRPAGSVPKIAAPAARPAATAATDLGTVKVAAAAGTASTLESFLEIQADSSNRDISAPLRTVATYWRGQPAAAQSAFSTIVDTHVTQLHSQVYLVASQQTLTLAGKSGDIPVTIVNNLPTAVRVGLSAQSSLGTRLKIKGTPPITEIGPSRQLTVNIPVQVVGNGQDVQVQIQLMTPGRVGQPPAAYSATPTVVTVKVSAIGIIALALMFGSAALLVFAIGLRVYRANRAHHAAAQDTMAS